jgi:hypothetical protein
VKILRSITWTVMGPPEGRKGPGADMICLRCGAREAVPTPLPISQFASVVRPFQDKHCGCKEVG